MNGRLEFAGAVIGRKRVERERMIRLGGAKDSYEVKGIVKGSDGRLDDISAVKKQLEW